VRRLGLAHRRVNHIYLPICGPVATPWVDESELRAEAESAGDADICGERCGSARLDVRDRRPAQSGHCGQGTESHPAPTALTPDRVPEQRRDPRNLTRDALWGHAIVRMSGCTGQDLCLARQGPSLHRRNRLESGPH